MASILDRLVAVAGPALAPPLPDTRPVPTPLVGLLLRANGFFAFGSALHVLPCEPVPPGTMSLQRWNDIDLWRSGYDEAVEGLTFFAEDIFGHQFALREEAVVGFDPEVENLYALNAVEGMRVRADVAGQTRHLPDGTVVRLKVVDSQEGA